MGRARAAKPKGRRGVSGFACSPVRHALFGGGEEIAFFGTAQGWRASAEHVASCKGGIAMSPVPRQSLFGGGEEDESIG
jgi:hypothetical protein